VLLTRARFDGSHWTGAIHDATRPQAGNVRDYYQHPDRREKQDQASHHLHLWPHPITAPAGERPAIPLEFHLVDLECDTGGQVDDSRHDDSIVLT
jgi:hypothetical protein